MNEKTIVTIVGAGPTGLLAACQCIRFGIDFILLDKKEGPTKESRALAIQARSMEVFQQLGIAHEFTSRGYKTQSLSFFAGGKKRATVPIGNIGEGMSAFPFILVLEQFHTEKILYNFITNHGKDVLWNVAVTSISEQNKNIFVTYETNNTQHEISCKYLIGADGAKSIVRHYLKTEFHGGTYENIFFVADLEVRSKLLPKELCVMFFKKTFAAFFPMQGENKYRMVGILPEEFRDEHTVTFSDIEDAVKSKMNIDITFQKLNWFSIYRLHHRMAKNFRRGNIFLAGDAAHIHSPVGGQGMNTGLQDIYNLTWKLWLIEHHGANLKLPGTYEEERIPFAKRLLRTTDAAFRIVSNANVFTNFFRLYITPSILSIAMRIKFLRRVAFKNLSQIGFHYKNKSLNKGKAGKISAGMRLPYCIIHQNEKKINTHELVKEAKFTLITFNCSIKFLQQHAFIHQAEIEAQEMNKNVLRKAGFPETFICLVRPDAYIGFISAKPDTKALEEYIQKTYFS